MITITLQQDEPKILYLALLYHLARPGSEIDPETGKAHIAALKPVMHFLTSELNKAIIELNCLPKQIERIDTALSGLSNELRQYVLSSSSVVPNFENTLIKFWPEIAVDSNKIEEIMMLTMMTRRKLETFFLQAQNELKHEELKLLEERRLRRSQWWKIWKKFNRS